MKPLYLALFLGTAVLAPALAQQANNPFAGRWDLTVMGPKVTYPVWLEVVEKGGSLEVRAQPRIGSVRPVTAKMDGSRLILTASATPARPASGRQVAMPAEPEVTWELTVSSGKLSGIQKRAGAEGSRIAGVPAPAMKRPAPKAWTNPEPLFNGKDLTGWTTTNNTEDPGATVNHWVVEDGELVNQAKGHNILTTRKFDDFRLHLEFNFTENANSGVYLRGRYEVQMPPPGTPYLSAAARRGPAAGKAGAAGGRGAPEASGGYAIYGFVRTIATGPGNPDEWRTYDITLVGRNVTLVVNGVTIVDNQEIQGITGGALDSNEAEPGPILLQGDHTSGVRYRNITISVPQR